MSKDLADLRSDFEQLVRDTCHVDEYTFKRDGGAYFRTTYAKTHDGLPPREMASVQTLWTFYQAGAAYQRAQQPQATDWQPSGADYDRSIHANPDAKAWADFFVATFPGLADKHDLMLGWFANAMMAMHDYLKAQQPQSAEAAVPQWRYDALIQHAKHQDKIIAKLSEEKNTAWLYEQKEVWFWQGDGEDYPESLCCPVVIKADDLRALIAAATPQPSAGVVMPESVGVLILGGLFHGGSGPELGDIDIEPNMRVLERIQMELVTSSDDVHLELFARLNGKEVGRG